jgi:hypothetical protein
MHGTEGEANVRRREFIRASLGVGLSAAAVRALGDAGTEDRLKRRPYGKTGEELSVVGFGGIIVMDTAQAEADKLVAGAVEYGVNYFDVAPSYGNAQDQLGPALEPFRSEVFLACKSALRDAAGCRGEMENSLRVMRTDHFDLYQLHGLAKMDELETAFAPGGAMETLVKARDAGEVRYLGFSAHSVEVALRAMELFAFDSVLFPFNCVCMERGAFGRSVLDEAERRGTACLALKAMAWRPWPEGVEHTYPKCWYEPIADLTLARLALSYTLDLGVTAALPPGDARLFGIALASALGYRPLRGSERAELVRAMEGVPPIFSHAQ